MIPKSVIIIGGGSSIQEGISKGLWQKLEGKFTIGCNYSYRHFLPTMVAFVDRPFFHERKQELLELPLVVGKAHNDIVEEKQKKGYDNLLLLGTTNAYFGRDAIKKNRVYTSSLVGLFTMTISVALGVTEFYLLGYDWTIKTSTKKDERDRIMTHYYQADKSLNHRGIGKTNYYSSHKADDSFKYYAKDKTLTIYNVSLLSNIDCFPKISYDEFFERLAKNSQNYNQEELRNEIKKTILDMQKMSKDSSK
ncbi:MAG: hypothetical protein JW924_03190 [Fusobacteriaceae bacterium]|nr:hypothetical protein [Fusobacteriaceae bacterium]